MGRGDGDLNDAAALDSDALAEPRSSKDSLGDRMKGYEAEWKLQLPPRTLKMLRLDGRAFHTWARGLQKPYSRELMEAMGESTRLLMEEIPGAIIGYTQSDEISILFGDFSSEQSQPWFGGNAVKICSVAASVPAAVFARRFPEKKLASFDARVFTLPSRVEAANALIWRQRDGQRNAISLLAQNEFSPKQLHQKSTRERKQMLTERGVDLASEDPGFLNGVMVVPESEPKEVTFTRKGESKPTTITVERSVYKSSPAEHFSASAEDAWLLNLIPEPPATAAESDVSLTRDDPGAVTDEVSGSSQTLSEINRADQDRSLA